MDRMNHYRQAIKQVLMRQAQGQTVTGQNYQQQVVIDETNDHYLLVSVGWDDRQKKRIYGTVLHFDICDGKIWVQQNTSDVSLEDEFAEHGIHKDELVPGFLPSTIQMHHEYAID